MLETLFKVIERSGSITVYLISDGEEEISGTDFDTFINLRYSKSEVRRLRKQKVPFITVLKATEGRIRGWSVQSSPEPIVIPQVPLGQPSFVTAITKQPAQSKKTLNSGKTSNPLMKEIQDSDQVPELSISEPIPENDDRPRIDSAESPPGKDIENDPVAQETGSSNSDAKENIEEVSLPSQQQHPTLFEPVSINNADGSLPISTPLDKVLKSRPEQKTKANTDTQKTETPSIPPLQESEEMVLAMSNSQESALAAEKVDSSQGETPIKPTRVSLEKPKLTQPPPNTSSPPDLGKTASDKNSGMRQPDNKGAFAPWPILATGLGLAGIVFAGCAVFLLRKAGFGKNTSLITRSMNDHE
ncbi:MAG TPA: hypothetical protein EYG38_19615 [Verrucomicrobia bacterium]|nr:hypothetical protein [Verrucomicrobiota bacterium]